MTESIFARERAAAKDDEQELSASLARLHGTWLRLAEQALWKYAHELFANLGGPEGRPGADGDLRSSGGGMRH